MDDDEKGLVPVRSPKRSELQHTMDKQLLAEIALKNPAATSSQLSVLFESRTGRSIRPRTIRDDLKSLKKQWLAEAVDDFKQLRAVELKRVDHLEQEASDAWEQSKSDFIKTVVERVRKSRSVEPDTGSMVGKIVAELADKSAYVNEEVIEKIVEDALNEALDNSVESGEDEDMFIAKIIETTEVRIGDVAFFREIHKLQQERRRILGVYAPELHEVNVKKVSLKGYIGWSPEEWGKDDDIVEGEVE